MNRAIEILPAINVKNFKELKEKIKIVKPYVKWVQIDVADGKFTNWKTWNNPRDLSKLKNYPKIEVHLMIADIDKKIKNWLYCQPIKRIIFHLEAAKNPDSVIAQIKKAKKEVGVAINPNTPVSRLKPYLNEVKFFQILGVDPGRAGQKFQKKVLKKVKWLRDNCKDCSIEGDGGMKKGVIKDMTKAGADIFASASAIFSNNDIKKAISELKKDI